MRLIKSVSISLIAKFIGTLIAVPTSIIIARYLGPTGKGAFAVIAAVSGIAVQLGNFGLQASNTYFSAKSPRETVQIAANSIWAGFVLGMILLMSLFLFFTKAPDLLGSVPLSYMSIVLVGLPFIFISLFLQNLFLGMQKIYEYNFIETFYKFIYLLAILVTFSLFKGYLLNLIITLTMISIATAITYMYFINRNCGLIFKFDIRLLREMFRYGFKAYLATLFAYLVIRSDILLVNFFSGLEATGFYSLSVGLIDLLQIIPITVGAILFSKATAIGDEKSQLTRKVSRHMVVVMGLICLGAFFTAKPLIIVAFGNAFSDSVLSFKLLLPGIFFLSLQTVYMQDFAARGMPPIVYIVPASGFLFNLVLNILLIPKYGIVAAAITSSLAYFLMFIIALIYFRKISSSKFHEVLLVKPAEIAELVVLWRDRFFQPMSS